MATIIVTRGTLRKSCVLVAGLAHAKVRGLFDHNNQPIDHVTPGMPAEILGWRELPDAGDITLEVESEKKASSVIKFREQKTLQQKAEKDLTKITEMRKAHDAVYQEQRKLTKRQKQQVRRETMESEDSTPKLNIIIKADVHGSMEALLDVLDTYDCSDKCKLNVVHYGVGPVNDGDIELAEAFNAYIYTFCLPTQQLKSSNAVIKEFNIIYRFIEDITNEINKKLPAIEVEDVVGEAEIRQLFQINDKNKKVTVLGCRCTKGLLKKKLKFKIVRDDEVIFDGNYFPKPFAYPCARVFN